MKICNRLLSLVLAVLMLVPLSILPAVAAKDDEEFVDTNFSFEIESVTYTEADNPAAGDTISLEVCVQNLTDEDDLGSIELRLNYDDTKLEFIAAREKTGSGKNAVTHMAGYFGLFQSAAPKTNPAKNYIVNVAFENQKWDSEWDINNDIFMMVDFKVLGDWGGSTEIQLDGQAQRRADALFYRGENGTRDITWGKATITRPGAAAEPVLESIAVTTLPTKTEYLEGKDDLDLSGGKLTLTYDDESTEEIDLSEATVTGFDKNTVGPQTLTVTYEGKTCTFDVTVAAKSITGISVDRLPSKLTYVEGEELDLTGGQIEVAYNNGTYTYQRMLDATVTGYDKNTVGPQTVTVSYEGFTCTFEVTVTAKVITSIEVTTLPTKTVYMLDEGLNLTGGKLTVYYNNDTSEELDLIAGMIASFDNRTLGPQTLTVTYAGFSCTFDVVVVEKEIDYIDVIAIPKDNYFVGESLVVDGTQLAVYYTDGTYEVLDVTIDMISEYDFSAEGPATVTVSYRGKSAGFNVNVLEKAITSIAVTTLPNKLIYKENKAGERELDPTGGVITLTYEDNSTSTVALSEATLTGFDTLTAGAQEITVTYAGLTCTYSVTVEAKVPVRISIADEHNIQKEYLEGVGELSITGAVSKASLYVFYDNDTYDGQELTLGMISGFDNTVVGKQTLTVTYQGLTCTFDVEIIAKSVESISLSTLPDSRSFLEGKNLEVVGGRLTVNYNNGTHDVVDLTPAMVSGYDKNAVGDQTLTVTYEGKTCTYTVAVIAKSVESIEVTKLPTKTEYVVGEELDVTGGQFTVYYNNGTHDVLDLSAANVSPTEFEVTGTHTVSVEYGSYTDIFEVEVVEWVPVEIVDQTGDVRASYNKTAKVTVTAEGEGLTYAWYYKDKGMTSFKLTTTFTGNTYSVAMTAARSGRQVYCVVTDEQGCTDTSEVVTLSMNARIKTQPKSVTVAYGKTAKVTVKAEGEGLVYKWYYKNKGATKFVRTTTFSGDTYTAEMNASRSGRQIYVVVEDQFGNRVASKVVTLSMEARIATQPKSVTVASGKTAKATVKAEGEGLKYTWYYKDKGASKFVKTSSFTGSSYYVVMNSARAGRQVYCKITDKFGNTVTTNTVTLKMK